MKNVHHNRGGHKFFKLILVLSVLILICLVGYFTSKLNSKITALVSTPTTSTGVIIARAHTVKDLPTPVQPFTNGSSWDGYKWLLTDGAMTGVINGNPANVLIDQNGYLHIRITNNNGIYSAGELFSAESIGFGTYQWQIEGSLSNLDPSTVVGLFLYGPENNIGIDGEDEIDIEFSRWNNTICNGSCNADFTVYPSTGNEAIGQAEEDYTDPRTGPTITTARVTWSSNRITETVMNGLEPLGTTQNVIYSWTFAPSNYLTQIPQQALPIGMNLWSFKELPTSNQEIIIRDFTYEPQ